MATNTAPIFTCTCCLFQGSDRYRFEDVYTAWANGGDPNDMRWILLCRHCSIATDAMRDARHELALEARAS